MEAPEYQPGDSIGSVYCSRALQHRKKLFRTANILKAALLTYREVEYDIDLTKIELQNEVLYLHQNQRFISARAKRGLFPEHLTTNIEHRKAALANNQCTMAMALLGRLTRKLLEGETAPPPKIISWIS